MLASLFGGGALGCAPEQTLGYVLLAPGEGPANAGSLLPLRAGGQVAGPEVPARAFSSTLLGPSATRPDAFALLAGHPTVVTRGGEGGESIQWTEQARLSQLEEVGGDVGAWERAGEPRHAFLAMIVPAEVRSGMRWETQTSPVDSDVLQVEVTRREEIDSVWGPSVEWTLVRTDPDGSVTSTVYAEDVGVVGWVGPDGAASHVESGALPVVAPALPTLPESSPLEPLFVPDGDPARLSDTTPMGANVFVDPDGELHLAVARAGGNREHEGCFHLAGRPEPEVSAFCGFVELGGGLSAVAAASGALVTPAGVLGAFPEVSPSGAVRFVKAASSGALALFRDAAQDRVHALWRTALHDGAATEASFAVYELRPDGAGWELEGAVAPNGFVGLGAASRGLGTDALEGFVVAMAPEGCADAGPCALPGVLVSPTGVVSSFALTRAGLDGWALTQPLARFFAAGRPSVRTSTTERDVVLARADGLVQRVAWVDGAPVLERVGRVELPDDHALHAAFEDPASGYWYLVSHQRDVGQLGGGGDATWLWRARLEGGAPAAEQLAATVTASESGRDVVLCWAESAEPLDTSGWSLGGAPAAIVESAHAPCAVLVRDGAAGGSGRLFAEASVPGVGAVRVAALANEAAPWGFGRLAGTADGGFAAASGLYDRGGRQRSRFPWTEGEPLPDPAGGGLWRAGSLEVAYASAGGWSSFAAEMPVLRGLVQGGGVVVQESAALTVHFPDGTTGDSLGSAAGVAHVAVLADGRPCFDRGPIGCLDADGSPGPTSADLFDATIGLVPAPDGTLLSSVWAMPDGSPGGTYAFDPATAALTLVDSRAFGSFTYDPSGALWLVLCDADYCALDTTTTLARWTGAGLDALSLTLPPELAGHAVRHAAVTDEWLYLSVSTVWGPASTPPLYGDIQQARVAR